MSILLSHNSHDLHQLKKSVAPPPGQSGYEGTIYQYNYDNVISCVCIASCCAGAFLYFETNCPEVRGGSPGCRSPPSPVSVTHPPNTETEVYL